jgi:hypothetical protein
LLNSIKQAKNCVNKVMLRAKMVCLKDVMMFWNFAGSLKILIA